jgi:hypothetical protein
MEQSPSWEADSRSVGQQIPRLLCNPKDHYLIYKNPPLQPVLNHLNAVHAFVCVSLISVVTLSFHLSLGLLSGLSFWKTRTGHKFTLKLKPYNVIEYVDKNEHDKKK